MHVRFLRARIIIFRSLLARTVSISFVTSARNYLALLGTNQLQLFFYDNEARAERRKKRGNAPGQNVIERKSVTFDFLGKLLIL